MKNILISIFMAITLAACSGSARNNYDHASDKSVTNGVAVSKSQTERMFSRSASLRLSVDDNKTAYSKISTGVGNIGGHVESVSNKHITVSIPTNELDRFIEWLDDIGKVRDLEIFGRDVTDSQSNLSSELQVLQASRDRYQSMFNNAETTSDKIKIQAELDRLDIRIQQLERRISGGIKSFQMSHVSVRLDDSTLLGSILPIIAAPALFTILMIVFL